MTPDLLAMPTGLFGRALRSLLEGRALYLALFIVVNGLLAATSTPVTILMVIELVLICVPQAVLTLRRRMSTGTAIACAVGLLAAAAAGVVALPQDGRPLGYAAWQLGAITISLFGFALVGRYLAAWLTLLGVSAICVGWSVSTGQGWLPGVQLIDRQIGTLLVGTLFAYALQRSTAAFTAYRALERRTRSLERAAAARAGARRSAAEAVLEQAGPMLHAIADGRPLTDADRRELLVLEGALRDQIRAPQFAVGVLRESIASARRRGVNVLLLDETEAQIDPEARDAAASWLAGRLDAAHGERFVGRIRATAGALKVTAVAGSVSDWASFPISVPLDTAPLPARMPARP